MDAARHRGGMRERAGAEIGGKVGIDMSMGIGIGIRLDMQIDGSIDSLRGRARGVAALLALAALCNAAAAQQATYPVRSITPEAALRAARAAMVSCAKSGFQVAVAVTDRSGNALVMLRDRHAGPHTPATATGKAWTALTFKTDTLSFSRLTQAGGAMSGIRELPGVVAIGGGLMIESAGSLVGAIGVSGAPGGEADEACAKAGIAEIKDDLEF